MQKLIKFEPGKPFSSAIANPVCPLSEAFVSAQFNLLQNLVALRNENKLLRPDLDILIRESIIVLSSFLILFDLEITSDTWLLSNFTIF